MMAICDWCLQEMTGYVSCHANHTIHFRVGKKIVARPAVPFNSEAEEDLVEWFKNLPDERYGVPKISFDEWYENHIKSGNYKFCHDCGCPDGGFHHPGCDAERCPMCGGQLISCGCKIVEI
jgi:hypothetical protein